MVHVHSSNGIRLVGVVLDLCGVGLLLCVSRLRTSQRDTGGNQVRTFQSSCWHVQCPLNVESWHSSHQLIHTYTPFNCIRMHMHLK